MRGRKLKYRHEIKGQLFGSLTALEFSRFVRPQGVLWKFKCSCGKICEKRLTNVVTGATRSCGRSCPDKEATWRSHWQTDRIMKTKPGEIGLDIVYKAIKRNAEQSKREFKLSLKQVKRITSKNCFYCGKRPSSIARTHTPKLATAKHSEYVYNGIDRINNKKGYIPKNCRTCCTICNLIKGSCRVDFFKLQIKRIYENLKLNKMNDSKKILMTRYFEIVEEKHRRTYNDRHYKRK